MNIEELAFKDRKILANLNAVDLLNIIEFLQDDSRQCLEEHNKLKEEITNLSKEIDMWNSKYNDMFDENQELKLELSGYRQAILNNKEMLGLKEQNEKLKKIKKNTSSGACICKKVICIETNEKFLSTTQASEKTGVQRYKISEMCNNKKKHEKCSLHFRFEED